MSCSTGALAAQQNAPVPAEEERPFLAEAAKQLDAYATLCVKNGHPRKARLVWLEVVAEYAPDDEIARRQLGFVRQGTVWQKGPAPDPGDDDPDPRSAQRLLFRWEALARDLGRKHQSLAEALEEHGSAERAAYHRLRALRFLGRDPKAGKDLGLREFEGVPGTPVEIDLLRRSRAMDRVIAEQSGKDYPVEACDLKESRLDRSGLPYRAVRSEHFVVFGDYDPPVLEQAAKWSERALAFCRVAFDGEEWAGEGRLTPNYAYFRSRKSYEQVILKNAHAFRDVDFLVHNTSSCDIGRGRTGLQLSGIESEPVVYDFAVRKVVQEYSRASTDGLTEGIGHAVVGMFFGRNLIALVGQLPEEGTVSARDAQRYSLPDIETWKRLATELAFLDGGAPAARLPLLKAAKFSAEARIKAWSFYDYLLRRDPRLFLRLDQSSAKARHEGDVAEEFRRLTGGADLAAIERDWRRYWTTDSPARRAIEGGATPLESSSKDGPKWLAAFSELRTSLGLPAVGWSSDLSALCKGHASYLAANRSERGPEAEATERPGKSGFSQAGRSFAATALISVGSRDPGKAMKSWLDLPGYRDAILDRDLETVGLFAEGGIAVFDVSRGRGAASTVALFPRVDAASGRMEDPVPSSVAVAMLGRDVEALLAQHGRKGKKQIGYPLTLHLHGAAAEEVNCRLTQGDREVEGVLVRASSGRSRRTSAPGLWVYYPLDPLKRGVDHEVLWTHGQATHRVVFSVR
ncbi:MAG: hypothetical protein Fur0037_29190 [Planctomycetota bacterium]